MMTAIERTRSTWRNMKGRCNAQEGSRRHKYYANISVCDRWLDFNHFVNDMGLKPEGLSIDRVDNTGDYEPGNCRWATQKEQVHNSSDRQSVV